MRPTELGEAIQYDQDETQAFRHNNLALALARLMGGTPKEAERWIDPDRIENGDPDDLDRWAAVSCHGDRFDRHGWTSTYPHRDQAEGALYECIGANCPGEPLRLVDLDNGISYEPRIHLTFKALGEAV